MAKVSKKFRERYQDMKVYDIGDEYPDDNADRVSQLIALGYLERPAETKSKRRRKGADNDADPDA